MQHTQIPRASTEKVPEMPAVKEANAVQKASARTIRSGKMAWTAAADIPADRRAVIKGRRRDDRGLKKIKSRIEELKVIHSGKVVRLMFQDEAGFGRINKPKYCWCEKGCTPQCALSPYPGVLLCLRSCGAADGRKLLFGASPVQCCLHECISAGSVQGIPE